MLSYSRGFIVGNSPKYQDYIIIYLRFAIGHVVATMGLSGRFPLKEKPLVQLTLADLLGDVPPDVTVKRKSKKLKIPRANSTRVRSRFGNQSRDEIAAVLRGRLISKIDLLFAKKEGVLAAVLEVCDAADALAAAIQDGDGDAVKTTAARFRMLRLQIPGASRGMSAVTLFQAVMQGLFPEEFAEEDEPDQVARDVQKQFRAAKEAAPDSEKRLKKRLGKLARIVLRQPSWYDLQKDKTGVMPPFGGHYADEQLEIMLATV